MIILFATVQTSLFSQTTEKEIFQWNQLPSLPVGLGGQFVGNDNGVLIVAGGSYFESSMFEGGKKIWVDTIYVLLPDAKSWKKAGHLPDPLAGGASISTEKGVVCIGGGTNESHSKRVLLLHWENGKITQTALPDLPCPNAYFAAAKVGNHIYVADGQETPDAREALHVFWRLDLNHIEKGWKELPPHPGSGRILAAAAGLNGKFYLFSGARIFPDSSGKMTREYLTESYSFSPKDGWKKIADVPRPVLIAPAVAFNPEHIFIFGGDDGKFFHLTWELKDKYPGFRHDILSYHPITDTWTTVGNLPESYVATVAVELDGKIVIAGGEDRPGHRSQKVFIATVLSQKSGFSFFDYFVIFIYFALLIVMGIYFARREKSTGDFFLANQRIPWWAAGISIFGTQLSAITFLAAPAKSYAEDWVYFLVNMTIILIAPIVVYCYLPHFRKMKITSAYEYLENRFNLATRLFGSIAFLLFQVGRMGIVLFLPAIVLSTATGFNIFLCILLMGILATIYTALGGIEAVIWTDVIQVFVLMGGALLAFVLIALKIDGGFSEIFHLGWAENKFHMVNWTWDFTRDALWVVIVGNIFANLIPYTTDQTVVQRYLTTSTEKQAAKSIWTNAVLTIPASLIFFGLGTALFVYYKHFPVQLDPTLPTDAIFPLFIVHQLPFGIAGLVVAGIFAASMSSLDSSLNSMSAVVITDFVNRLGRKRSEAQELKLARILTLIFGVFGTATAVLLASLNIQSLLDAFREILGLFGGSLGGLFALGIFTKKANGPGALIGAFSSAILLWLVKAHTEMHFFLYAAVGTVSCFVIGYFMSYFFKNKSEE